MLNTRVEKGIGILEIDRPDVRNAFTANQKRALGEFGHFESDPSIQAVLLCSTGKTFCAGADLRWMASLLKWEERVTPAQPVPQLVSAPRFIPKPLVCRVQGAAVEGGNGKLRGYCRCCRGSPDGFVGSSVGNSRGHFPVCCPEN